MKDVPSAVVPSELVQSEAESLSMESMLLNKVKPHALGASKPIPIMSNPHPKLANYSHDTPLYNFRMP